MLVELEKLRNTSTYYRSVKKSHSPLAGHSYESYVEPYLAPYVESYNQFINGAIVHVDVDAIPEQEVEFVASQMTGQSEISEFIPALHYASVASEGNCYHILAHERNDIVDVNFK
jgi:hypothetical protein